MQGLVTAVLHLVLFAFSIALIGLVIDAYIGKADDLLIMIATAVLCLALIGILWKTISIQSKVGLAILGIGLVLTWPHLPVRSGPAGLPWVWTVEYVWPLAFGLALIVVLIGVWLLVYRKTWLALLLSIPVLYALSAPIGSLIEQKGALDRIVLGPSSLGGWPVYVLPGFLTVEVILPAGVLLMLVLQLRTLVSKHRRSHFGYIFWALFMILVSSVGLSALDKMGKPVIVSPNDLMTTLSPQSPTPVQTMKPAVTEAVEKPAVPDADPASEESRAEPSPPAEAGLEKQSPATVPPVAAESAQPESEILERIERMEQEIQELKNRIEAQESLLKSLAEPEPPAVEEEAREPETQSESPPATDRPKSGFSL